MKIFKADLHIHSVLSPCASLDMSPKNIVHAALEKGLDIIAVTDHNSTLQCKNVLEAAKNTVLTVFLGVEINSKEEIHALAYFETLESLESFQKYIDEHLPFVKNNPDKFGYQVVVDTEEKILYEEEKLLIVGMSQSIEQIERKVHELGGIFIPAHIDKSKFSLISQLGFIPSSLVVDGIEITSRISIEKARDTYQIPVNQFCIYNSDAHIPERIGTAYQKLFLEVPTFQEYKMALSQYFNRTVIS